MKKIYSSTQDWIEEKRREGDRIISRIGISQQFVKDIGPIVWIDLPEIDTSLSTDSVAVVIESTKAAIDILAPCKGTVISKNNLLFSDIGMNLLNEDPEGEGWLYEILDIIPS